MISYIGKATIYHWHPQGWGFVRLEVQELDYGEEPMTVQYVKKGSRSQQRQRCDSDPMVVLQGWNHPDMNLFGETQRIHNSVSKAYLYPSVDPRWEHDFDLFLTKHLDETSSQIIVDYRGYYKEKRNVPKPLVPEDDSDPFAEDEDDFAEYPDQTQENESKVLLNEGTVDQTLINEYERNPKARNLCIEHYGATCVVCGFNFFEFYGDAARDVIHVHHLIPLAAIGHQHEIDPIADLRPVCPNCHAVIHKRNPIYTIDEVQQMVSVRRQK